MNRDMGMALAWLVVSVMLGFVVFAWGRIVMTHGVSIAAAQELGGRLLGGIVFVLGGIGISGLYMRIAAISRRLEKLEGGDDV